MPENEPGLLPGPVFVSDNHIPFLHVFKHFDSLQTFPWRGLLAVPDLAEGCGLSPDFLHLLAVALSPGLLVALACLLGLLMAFIHAERPLFLSRLL